VDAPADPLAYPGVINGKHWDRAALEASMAPAVAFAKKHRVHLYVGEFKQNRVHGHGTLLMPNGDRYDGQFVQGRRHGTGVYSFASGGQYRGQFTDDHLTGFGHFTYTNGDRYSGQFLDGAHHGLGRLISGSGRATQEGRWENGVFVWPQRIEQF
jgi:hypothetical protein